MKEGAAHSAAPARREATDDGVGEDKVPITEELLAVQAQLRQLAAKQVALEDRCRVQAWRESMDEAWKDKRREVYRWVKG